MTRSLRMTLSYDGTNYCGWQVQPNGISIQSVVEKALTRFTGETIKVVASGRTDAGVHAVGQVISFTTQSSVPNDGFVRGLPGYLPDEIVVRDVQETASGFNARYHAKRKWYRYVIHNSPVRVPFLRDAVLWYRARLNDVGMNEAVQSLVGTHDFRCFESHWPNRSTSIRTIFHASVTRQFGWNAWDSSTLPQQLPNETPKRSQAQSVTPITSDAEFLVFDVEADGFLYNMVRAIAGTLIHIGRGRWTTDDLCRILETGERAQAGDTAPPQGLYLMRVDY